MSTVLYEVVDTNIILSEVTNANVDNFYFLKKDLIFNFYFMFSFFLLFLLEVSLGLVNPHWIGQGL